MSISVLKNIKCFNESIDITWHHDFASHRMRMGINPLKCYVLF